MTKKEIFVCDFCGCISYEEDKMQIHEELCIKNPKNQPCSSCRHLCIIGGCEKGIDYKNVDGKTTLCIFFEEGEPPLTPFGV